MTSTLTDRDARNEVIEAIEAGDAKRDDYNIDAIVDELRDMAGGLEKWDTIEPDAFWAVVARHLKIVVCMTCEKRFASFVESDSHEHFRRSED